MSINYPASRNVPMDAHNAEIGAPTRYPVLRCAFAPDAFTRDQREWIAVGVASMSALGPTCVWITDGTRVDVVFAHWPDDNSASTAGERPGANAAQTTRLPDGSRIDFDPAGLRGASQWQQAAAHEIGHVLGMGHVDPAKHGPAIMNPTLYEILDPDALDVMRGNVPPSAPTTSDFAEYDRVHGRA